MHQLFFWIDQSPEYAFDQAAVFFTVMEITWDTLGLIWNSAVEIVNSGIVPIWNALVYYTVEPTLSLLLEVFSIVFLRQPWPGIVGDDFEYNGLDCTATDESYAWCGRYGHYAGKLEEEPNQFTDETQSYGSRRSLMSIALANETFTFGLATARRLSELAGGDAVATPAFSTQILTNALDAVTNFILAIFPALLDMFFAIFGEIVTTSFSLIMDVVDIVLTQLMQVGKMLIKSGMMSTIMNVGIDFLVIMVTELALPMIFAMIDGLMCLLDLFAPAGWSQQLECVELTCFQGASITSDITVFYSLPIIMHRFTAIMDASLNSRSGKKFVKGPKADFTSVGKSTNPKTGVVVNNEEPEGAQAGNPTKEFSFADDFSDWIGTTAADECAQCFVCKVPELRLIWLLIASIGSLFSGEGFNTFMGNVTDNCLANGSFYLNACGPRGSEDLTFPQWQLGGYTAGFAQIDARIFDSYAAEIIDMHDSGEMGTDERFGQLVAAARQWDEVHDESFTAGKAERLVYHM